MSRNLLASKVALGSAQWGLIYGISNNHGITNNNELKKILEIASNSGISFIDTAFSYGEAESNLGNFDLNNFKVVTKIKKIDKKFISKSEIIELDNNFRISLQNLNLKKVYGLLFHSSEDLIKDGGHLLAKKMIELKKVGLVDKIGISIYQKSNLDYILEVFKPDIIQMPINIFDQKLYLDGTLKKLKENNIEIHARSIFLQGLLLMDINNIPPYFDKWKNHFQEFQDICFNNNISKLEATLNFILGVSYVDKFILGFNNSDQLLECLNAKNIQKKIDFSNLFIEDLNLINPSLWKL